jgi:hypothetical protein
VKEIEKKQEERLSRENWPIRNLQFDKNRGLSGLIGLQKLFFAFLSEDSKFIIIMFCSGNSGRVVLWAIIINSANFGCKLVAWAFTGQFFLLFFSVVFNVLSKASINICCLCFYRNKFE